MDRELPKGIKILAYISIFGALMLIIFRIKSFFIEGITITANITLSSFIKIPFFLEIILEIVMLSYFIIQAYGLLELKTWGYYLFIVSSSLQIIGYTINSITQYESYIGNIFLQIISIIYLYKKRDYFFNSLSFYN